MKQGIAYYRVSTEEQAETGRGDERQRRNVLQWCDANQIELVGEYLDDCSGTIDMGERPEGRKMFAQLKAGGVDVIVADTVCRATRPKYDEVEFVVLRYNLKKWFGVDLVCLDSPTIGDAFADNIIGLAKAKGAKEEREKIIKRTSDGRPDKVRAGVWIGSGAPPFGYRKLGKGKEAQIEINEGEASIVRQMYQWYVMGDVIEDEPVPPLTDLAIARRLSSMGIKPPSETRGGTPRIRESGMWSFCTVREILMSETYAGVWHYGRTGAFRKGEKREKRAANQLIAVSVPPIIDRELWDAAQARRKYNKEMSARNTKREYLLRGLIMCSCGRKMTGMFTSGSRYRCSCETTFRRGMDYERRTCHEKTVNGERLEAVTWQYVIDTMTDSVRFESEWRKAQQAETDTHVPKRERLGVVETLISEAGEEAARIVREMSEYKESERERQSYKALRQQPDQNDDRYAKLSAEQDRPAAELEAASQFTDEALAGPCSLGPT